MSMSIQVMYPITETTNFDYDYYFSKHMKIVGETLGEHIQSTLVTKVLLVDRMFLLDIMLLRPWCLKISPRWI